MQIIKRRKGLPPRKSTKNVASAPIIQDLYPTGIVDDLGRHVGIPVPCWNCCHAIKGSNTVKCRAGVDKLAEIRTLSDVDPEAHGWPESNNARPMDEKQQTAGHRGRYFLTLETVLIGGLDRPTFREVIARNIAGAWTEDDGEISSEERARVADDIVSEISKMEYLDSSVLEELHALALRLMGSEDVMDRYEFLVCSDDIEKFGAEYDSADRPVGNHPRTVAVERENWSPPRHHVSFTERRIKNPSLHAEILRLYNGRLRVENKVFLATKFNIWGYINPGWITIRKYVKVLPIPDCHFTPDPDPGPLTEKTRGFRLIDRILCPIANEVPAATISMRETVIALMHATDPECLQALWRCLTPDLREKALRSPKISEEAKRYAAH